MIGKSLPHLDDDLQLKVKHENTKQWIEIMTKRANKWNRKMERYKSTIYIVMNNFWFCFLFFQWE